MIAAAAITLPSMASAAVVYDLTLTDSSNPTYSGTGVLTLDFAPALSGQTDYSGSQASLTITIDGQTFTSSPSNLSVVQFESGTLNDITFAEQIGTSPNRYDLQTTSKYDFYYNNEGSKASGTITARLASAVPEPMTWLMMIAGFGAIGALLRRRATSRQGETPVAG